MVHLMRVWGNGEGEGAIVDILMHTVDAQPYHVSIYVVLRLGN